VFHLRFIFTIVISFSLHAMLPLLANKDEYYLVRLPIRRRKGNDAAGKSAR